MVNRKIRIDENKLWQEIRKRSDKWSVNSLKGHERCFTLVMFPGDVYRFIIKVPDEFAWSLRETGINFVEKYKNERSLLWH